MEQYILPRANLMLIVIVHNTATRGISTSELNERAPLYFFQNTAFRGRGGLHTNSSTIKATSAFAWHGT